MPKSLRVKLGSLRYKGILADKDYKRLCKALDNEDVLEKIREEIQNLRNCSCSCSDGIIDDVGYYRQVQRGWCRMTNEMTAEEAVKQIKENCYFASISEKTKQALDKAIKALEQQQQPNRCDSCTHSEEQDGSNCYECIKGMADNFEAQPCEDCISRKYIEPIVEELENICINGDEHILSLLSNIKNAPPVKPERPKGKWIHWTDDYKDYCTCSKCGYGEEGELLLKNITPFCPYCGSYNGGNDNGDE